METEPISSFEFPPGFRFHPSDEELIVHYLLKKVKSIPLPASVIAEIELYNYNPWELPERALFGQDEWYFFSPRDRKYPNGVRPNRTAGSGYWKATGTDKTILGSGSKRIGVKKALVFYTGRPPKGVKTEWIMNEYRLPDPMTRPSRLRGSMRLDDWVLCRIRQKGNMSKNVWDLEYSPRRPGEYLPKIEELPPAHTEAITGMIADFNLPKDCHLLASLLAGQTFPHIETIPGANFPSIINSSNCGSVYEDGSDKRTANLTNTLFESFFHPSKGKSDEGNKYEYILQATKMTSHYKNEDLLPGNIALTNDMTFYNQNRLQGDIFKPNPISAIMNLQELNDSAFLDKYLE